MGQPLLRKRLGRSLLCAILIPCLVVLLGTPSALAGLNDDHFDGNIFPLYAGNGSIVPPRLTLKQSLKQDRPTLLVLYIDDSSDCKAYASVISQLDAFYGRAAHIIAIDVDSIATKDSYAPDEPGHYYKGLVPQTVLFNQSGDVVLNETGSLPFERIDDVFREVFDLLPRSESTELRRRRQINEISSEIVPENQ